MTGRRGALALSLVGLLCGCATTLHVQVDSQTSTNEGRPLYMMVRTVDSQALVSEDYEDAASHVFTYPPDPSVKKVQAIMPGQELSFTIPRPDEGALALYFFFTDPGTKWRLPLTSPLPSDVIIDLGKNNIRRVRVRRR